MRVMTFLAFLFQELQFLDFTGVNNFEWSSGQNMQYICTKPLT